MFVPVIAGFPLHLWLGLLLLLLVLFQVASARHMFSIPFSWHRSNGYILFVVALLHGLMAISVNLFKVPFK